MAVVLDEAGRAVLEGDARPGRDDAGAERPVDALDQRDRHPVAVDGAEVGRAAPRQDRGLRVERTVGADERATRERGASGVEQGVRPRRVRDVGVGVGERELHRLDLRVQPRLEAVVQRQREERRGALPVRRQLAHLDAAVVVAQRLDPLRAVLREVVLGEPRRRGDRRRDLPAVERRPAPPRRCARACPARPGMTKRSPSRARGTAPRVHAPTCRRCAPSRRRRGGRGPPRVRARGRARGGRSARRGPPTPDGARDGDRARAGLVDPAARRATPAARPEPFSPWSAPSCQTSANASPPRPLSVGSATAQDGRRRERRVDGVAARLERRSPARVASGWLVATIASAATAGIRRQPLGCAARTEQARRGRAPPRDPRTRGIPLVSLPCHHVRDDPQAPQNAALR